MKDVLPRVLLLDLDDTIIVFDAVSEPAWVEVCASAAERIKNITGDALYDMIKEVSAEYWSDPERHRVGRLRLDETRAFLVARAFESLGIADNGLVGEVTSRYIELREKRMHLFPGAVETLEELCERTRCALVTNGESHKQRGKIERFDLAKYFEEIFIEEELGFGKPDVRVYETAIERMGSRAGDTWMVGDNLAWDVAAPQSIGIRGIWHDWRGKGLPSGCTTVPDRIIRSLTELLE
jgi:putative hydrolase of the HAD superfamily